MTPETHALELTILAASRAAWGWGCFFFLLFAAVVAFLVMGIRRVPVGAAGVVISMGSRTGQVKTEGLTWLPPFLNALQCLYVRERQIDVPQADYYTADRARIAFKTTLRVAVNDPAALFDQGPGTYGPFTRDGYGDATHGAEEANIALRSLVQNSIRESVQSLTMRDVMFGGRGHGTLRDRILQGLSRTANRWGLAVLEVWLTDVEAEDEELRRAVQAEVRESMEGRGRLAEREAEIRKGALFGRVAGDVVEDVRQRLGKEISIDEVTNFLVGAYQNDRALDIALQSAGGTNDLLQMFYLQYLGMPLPQVRPLPMGTPAPQVSSSRRPAALGIAPSASDGSWVIGREGDVFLDWDGVSRHHARVDVTSGQPVITDLGSTNGTYVNEDQIPANIPVALRTHDKVRFGKKVSMSVDELLLACRGRQIPPGRDTAQYED